MIRTQCRHSQLLRDADRLVQRDHPDEAMVRQPKVVLEEIRCRLPAPYDALIEGFLQPDRVIL